MQDTDFEPCSINAATAAPQPDRERRDAYVVVSEWSDQGPIVLETEGVGTSYAAARAQADRLRTSKNHLRVCVARLVFEMGNPLVLEDLKRLQK